MSSVVGFYTDKKGRKRPITKRNTIFFSPKHQYLADIVSLRSPEEAKYSANELLRLFNEAKTDAKRRRIRSATILAANRAKVMSKNERLSPKERREAAEIYRIYKKAYEAMK
jgi:hypothetical protein